MASRIRKLNIWMISDLSRLISPPPPCSPPSEAARASAGRSITHADTMEPSHTERRWSIGQIPPVSCCRRRFVKTITRGRAQGEAIGGRVDVDDVARAPLPEAEPATLADRVGRDAGVGAEHAAVPVDDGPRLEQVRVAPAQEAAVVVVGHEADLLALRLVGRDEAEPPRVRAHVVLVEVAHGKVRRREL